MACAPHTCTYHNTGTTTCVGHRAACPSNRVPSWTDAVQGGIIYASNIEELRANLRAEIDAYNNHASYASLTQTEPNAVSGTIYSSTINNLSNMVSQMYGNGQLGKVSGDLIDDADWDGLLARYDVLRQNCICNSDCSCNSVCACHGDCGCNYSDERLKENIEFLETKNDLNIYSWNYIWNKAEKVVGVIAQELIGTKYADAVTKDKYGYYMVNYNKLPI